MNARLGHGGKVDVSRDVLQTWKVKRVWMRMMTVVTHQTTFITLFHVVLVCGETIIKPQTQTTLPRHFLTR